MKNKENTLGANKQMAFLNTTKLAVLSAVLLLAVFCTIGMSFTPAEEGENIGNPNDSTYVAGPRRGHWSKDNGCGGTDNHKLLDYGTATAITLGGGTVTLSSPDGGGLIIEGNAEERTSGSDKYNQVQIKWHCNESATKGTSGNHLRTFTFLATPSSDEYKFDGWSTTDGNDIILSKGQSFTDTMTLDNYATEDVDKTLTYYAHFSKKQTATITFGIPVNGKYKLTDAEGDGEEVSSSTTPCPTLETKDEITLTATPDEKYKFFGWYKDTDRPENYLSYNVEFKKTFSEDITIYAKFIPKDAALFIIKDDPDKKQFWNLDEACLNAQSSSSKVVLPKDNGTLYPLVDGELCTNPEDKTVENCTIPNGVTLLIPYEATNTSNKATVARVRETSIATTPKCYRTLTIASGVNIIVPLGGSIEVGGEQNIANQTNSTVGGPRRHGKIRMASGSSITINGGASLYCWGYIVGVKDAEGQVIGEGIITANSNASVYECLQIRDWKGGTASQTINSDKEVFPASQYYAQNIEIPITFETGAMNKLSTSVVVSNYQLDVDNAMFIGEGGLFQMTEEAKLTRDYNESTDKIEYYLKGGKFNFKDLNLSFQYNGDGGFFDALIAGIVANLKIKSTDFYLPVTNNMKLDLESCTFNIASNILLLPGAEINVGETATVIATKNICIFDKDQWLGYEGTKIFPLLYANETEYAATASGTKKQYIRQWDIVQDANICLNGTLQVNGGNIYTTENGANIYSTGEGKVVFVTAAPTENGYVDQVIDPSPKYEHLSTNPAWLHNGEEWYNKDINLEYLKTKDCDANTTIKYANHHWGWMEIWKDHDGTILKINNTCLQTNNASAHTPTVPEGYINFIGWSTEINETNQEVMHTAHYSFGPELDIVDADNTNKTLTINANGWASSGWPYTVNGVKYEKDDRQPDRTLAIPYTGTSGASLPIVVLDKVGKPICRHIYKVPFVYTGTENMNAMNENSIVFVKSGTTLQTTDGAKAKEIYVAPGAELKVNGTLTVGKLVLRTTPWQSAVLTNSGTINGQVYYSRISSDSKQYYQFGLPLSCELDDVKMSNTDKLGGSQPKYGTAWMLKSYSESSRANNGISNEGANWDLLPSEGTITAGVGYEMFSNSNYYREFYFPITLPKEPTTTVSVSYTPDGAEGAAHAGWNIVTSPLTSKATVTIGDPATAITVNWLQTDGSYIQEKPTVIPPAIPFAYQAKTNGSLDFSTTSLMLKAPRKQSAAEALTETEWIHLDIYDAHGEGDETSLFVHPTRFEQTYKTGIDVAKQSLTAARPIIYSTHAYEDMAFAGIADSLLENGIDLAVYSPSAQELTFSLRENKFLHRLEYLWLADNETGARTDLLVDDYTCRANAGTTKGRFVLNGRFKAPQIATGIGNTQTDYNIYAIGSNIAISGVEQGTSIYVFDAVGHVIYTTSATSDEVIVPAPCAGVYMLSVGGQTAKLVINK